MVYYFKNKEGLFLEMLKTFNKSSVKSVPTAYRQSLLSFYNYFIENFMKNICKPLRVGTTTGAKARRAVLDFLRNYIETHHSTTGVAPNL